jgi:hypothetical protein
MQNMRDIFTLENDFGGAIVFNPVTKIVMGAGTKDFVGTNGFEKIYQNGEHYVLREVEKIYVTNDAFFIKHVNNDKLERWGLQNTDAKNFPHDIETVAKQYKYNVVECGASVVSRYFFNHDKLNNWKFKCVKMVQ